MSLDYRLREGMTNADLTRLGISNEDMFSFLSFMMLTGVPTLNKADLHEFLERTAQYAVVSEFDEEQLRKITEIAERLEGMRTNIARRTKAQWKSVLWDIIQSDAKTLQQKAEGNHGS